MFAFALRPIASERYPGFWVSKAQFFQHTCRAGVSLMRSRLNNPQIRCYSLPTDRLSVMQLEYLRDGWNGVQEQLARAHDLARSRGYFRTDEMDLPPGMPDGCMWFRWGGCWDRIVLEEAKRRRRGRGSVWPRLTARVARLSDNRLGVNMGVRGYSWFELGEEVEGTGFGWPGELREEARGLWRLQLVWVGQEVSDTTVAVRPARNSGFGLDWSSGTVAWWDGLLDSERDEVARRWLAWKKAVSPQVMLSRRKALMKYCRSIGLPPSGEYDL